MTGLIDQVKQLSAAEDFFDFFQVPYDRHVVEVSRLHILKRMGQYLGDQSFDGMSDDDAFLAIREVLARAYTDFTRSTPAEEKVFKVFRDQETRRAGAFVGLDTLTAPVSPSQTRQTAPKPARALSTDADDASQPSETQ